MKDNVLNERNFKCCCFNFFLSILHSITHTYEMVELQCFVGEEGKMTAYRSYSRYLIKVVARKA